MDLLVLSLLVVIVLAGGIIGVLADHLGRRIGKKKLSFRSMRPKHVARLGTFIAGTMVSLITILLVYSTSSGIREWITQGRAAIRKARLLGAQNIKLASDIAAKTSHIDDLDREAKLARGRLDEATNKLAAIKLDLTTANTNLAEARRKVTAGQVALARNQALLRKNQSLLKSQQTELRTVTSNLKTASARYANLKSLYGKLDVMRQEAEDEVVKGRRERTTLAAEVDTLKSDSSNLSKKIESDKTDLQRYLAELNDKQASLVSVTSELEFAKKDLNQVQQLTNQLVAVGLGLRSQPMTYSIGQEVVRKRLGPHLSERQARTALTVLIRDASIAAKARGAGLRENSESYAFVQEQQDPNGYVEPPEAIEEKIIQTLTTSDMDVVLVAKATENAFKGESVPLQIFGHPNPIVYHKGDVLDELKVARRTPARVVLAQFTDFMNNQVRGRAIKDGMIPAAGQEGSLLNLEPAKTIDLVERMANSDRPLRLQVIAGSDTRAADALQLDFPIK